jgi:toxin ParE1/3/4
MARVELAPEVGGDVERILEHLWRHEVADAPARIRAIIDGLSVLEHSPLIGRPTSNDLRELIIGRDTRGYVALYRYVPDLDVVFVLAVRGQREAGYKHP